MRPYRWLLFAAAIAVFALSGVAHAGGASITDRLSPDGGAIEVTSVPTGTKTIHVAVMTDLAGDGVKYLDFPASQKLYIPPAAMPVVDVQATSDRTRLGGWAGRLQTAGGLTQEPPIEEEPPAEPIEEEPPAEPIEEEPPAEPIEEELPVEPIEEPPTGNTIVGVDAGGWDWPSAVKDFAGAVKYVRSSYTNYNSDAQMSLLASNGVTLLPLFTGGSSIGAINRAQYATTLVNWFKRYGHGGTFWQGRTDLGATTAEILNEPGNPYFWSDPGNYTAYAALATAVHEALAAIPEPDRPRLLLSYDGGYAGDSYGRALLRTAPALSAIAGGWTVHPYGGTSNPAQSALGNRARVTEAHADTGQPVYVTEVGWPTAVGNPSTGDSLQWTEQQQAANLTGFIQWARSLGYVGAVVDFNYASYGTNDWYGIVDTTGTKHKLAYAALHALANE